MRKPTHKLVLRAETIQTLLSPRILSLERPRSLGRAALLLVRSERT